MAAVYLIIFLIAIDGGIGSRVLQSPLVSCTLIGLACGNPEAGIIFGANAEMLNLMLDENGGMGVFAACFVPLFIKNDISYESSADWLMSCLIFAMAAMALYHALMSLFVPGARNAAAKGSVRGLAAANFIPLLIRGIAAVCCAAFAQQQGDAIVTLADNLYTNYRFVSVFLLLLADLLPLIGLSVVLRNLSLKDHYGVLLAGFALAVCAGVTSNYVLLVTSMAGFGLAAFGFASQNHSDSHDALRHTTDTKASENLKKGRAEKWW